MEVEDEQGRRLARRRLPGGVAGIESLRALVADHPPATPRPTRCWSGSRPTAAHGCRRWSLPANRLVL